MRGFNDVNTGNKPVMGEAFYSFAVKQGNRKDATTLAAKNAFNRPAYCIGERRKEYERSELEKHKLSLKRRLEEI